LWSGINPIAAVDAIDVNSGFKQIVIAADCYAMTVDDISIMCCNLCYVTY